MAERTGNGGHGLVKGATVFGLAVPMIVIVPLVMLMSLSTILVAMVQSQYGTNCGLSNAAGTTTSWVEWAKNIAADDSHGYSQPRRTGNPDYDCSSLVYYALKQAGLDVGSYPFSTYGEDAALKHAGFERHDWSRVSDLQTGDIVWSSSHTEIYIGDGKFVGAHHDENNGIEGPKPGDQTGDEISIDSYAAGYAAYYRYKGSMNVNDPHGGQSSAQAVSGSTGSTNVVGMSEKDAEAWFNGQQGPNNMGASGSSGTEQCVTGDDSTSDVSGDKASAADAKKIARRKLKDFGWDDSQFDCLDKLWTRESGWQWNATNPSSGAYGIPQSLPGSKMASAGQDWKTNAATQVKWGLGYIQQRYQSPCGAWAHSEATGWY